MIRNYFFLNRFVVECSPILAGSILNDIFSQNKDIIIIEFSNTSESYFIEINTNPGKPYITLKNNFHRAKRNTISFFTDQLNTRLDSVSISDSDRIVRLTLPKGDLYFTIRGKYTNVHLINRHNEFKSFKKPEDGYSEQFKNEILNARFISELNFSLPKVDTDADYISNVKKLYAVLGKEITNEFKIREDNLTAKDKILEEILSDALLSNPVVSVDVDNFECYLLPERFHQPSRTELNAFSSIIDSFNFYIQRAAQIEEYKAKIKKIEKHLESELKKLSSKLNKLKIQIDKGSNEEKYKTIGNLLLINLSGIKKGVSEITLDNIYNLNTEINIKIDPKLSPEQNADKYFQKSRNEKISYLKSKEIFDQTIEKYNHLKKLKFKTEQRPEIQVLNSLLKELKIQDVKTEKVKQDMSEKFKHYIIENTYHVFVGKDSKNNDLLTTRFAKQNDFWFHARSVSGSHVVLRTENTKNAIPKNILKKAASLAAYHSKAKTAGIVPVTYCLKKYVVKKKSMPAGQVNLLKEDTLLVRPEIPEGCLYVQNDL